MAIFCSQPYIIEHLYWGKNLSSEDIGMFCGITGRTVRKKMVRYNIPRRTLQESLTKKKKLPFTGTKEEKAYFLGLRTGDFHAKRIRKCIRVQTSTTHPALKDTLRLSFEKYGDYREYYSKSKSREDEWFIYVDLHTSFDFLLEKPKENT